jgi:hypothetical protein
MATIARAANRLARNHDYRGSEHIPVDGTLLKT